MESKISIAKPCHENWNRMTPEEKGRHCAVCSKVVKDFTGMQTHEIIQELQTTTGEVCGRVDVRVLTPTTKRQQLDFWLRGFLMRKAIYPLMAFLGVSLFTKKAQAQNFDYPVKGKIAPSDYHLEKKTINLVVKTPDLKPVQGGTYKITSGLKGRQETLNLDAHGRTSITIEASEIISNEITVEISVPGFETQYATIKLIKNIQTVEVKLNREFIIMGEIAYIPVEAEPEKNEPVIDSLKNSVQRIEVETMDPQALETPAFLVPDTSSIERTVVPDEWDHEVALNETGDRISPPVDPVFRVFPVPAQTEINIVSQSDEIFRLQIFDSEGKTRQTVVNCRGTYILDVSTYVPGIYYLQLTENGNGVETKKVIVTGKS